MPTVLITGCDRGLGAEFARQYDSDGWRVHATCLDPDRAKELDGLSANASVHLLDLTDRTAVHTLAQELAGETVDVLLSNAALGINALGGHNPKVGEIDYDIWLRMFRTNTLGPVHLVECFLPQVERSEKRTVVFVSSRMGSITFNRVGGGYGYRTTKAALNAAAKSLSLDLLPRGITVLVLHPGYAKTFPPKGTVEVADSVAGMRRVIERSNIEDTGSFYAYDGTPLPW